MRLGIYSGRGTEADSMANTPLDAAAACTCPLKRPSGQLAVLNTISAVLCRQDGCLHVDVRAGSEGPGMACILHAKCAQHCGLSSRTPLILSTFALFASSNWPAALQRQREERDGNCLQLPLDDSGLTHLRKKERCRGQCLISWGSIQSTASRIFDRHNELSAAAYIAVCFNEEAFLVLTRKQFELF